MKRLNLLPSELRPRGGNVRHSTYAVLGGLLAATLAMTLYWFVQSGANSTANEIEGLHKETTAAKEDAASLGPYAAFSTMKDARERSVRVVAETRFDYERLTRELTRILPEHVWITGLDVGPTELDPEEGADSVQPAAIGRRAHREPFGLRPEPADCRRHARPPHRPHRRDGRGPGRLRGRFGTGGSSSGSGGGESLLQSAARARAVARAPCPSRQPWTSRRRRRTERTCERPRPQARS